MMPGLSTAAAASLVASFGASGAAAALLPGILAVGAAEGKAAAATMSTGLKEGGRVLQPTFTALGEDFRPEVVVPETKPELARPLLAGMFGRQPELLDGLFPAAAGGPRVVATFEPGAIQIDHVGDDPEALADNLLEILDDRLGELVGSA